MIKRLKEFWCDNFHIWIKYTVSKEGMVLYIVHECHNCGRKFEEMGPSFGHPTIGD